MRLGVSILLENLNRVERNYSWTAELLPTCFVTAPTSPILRQSRNTNPYLWGIIATFPSLGAGTVSFRSQLPGGYCTILLKDALYIPNLAANLVSLGTLQRNGAVFESIENGVKVTLDGDELFRASFVGISGTLYHISTVQIQSVSAYVAAVSPSLRTWHRRMAHLNLEAIRNMIRKDMVDGLSINGLHEYDHVCEGCVLGEIASATIPKGQLDHI